ncbi:unnamed protein product, partial [Didymodactylos carnosus]
IDEIAKNYSIPMYVCNRELYGYITAQFSEANFDETIVYDLYIHMLHEHQLNGPNQTYLKLIEKSQHISSVIQQEPTKFGLDEIYVINLKRRTDRRNRIKDTFDLLNIGDVTYFDAIDGKYDIDQNYLDKYQIKLLPDYIDPYNQRPINYGEIGCFLSHYFIWEDIVKRQLKNGVMILEDDVKFDVYFKYKLQHILDYIEKNKTFEWDLIYLGRKIIRLSEENYNSTIETYLIEPAYTHWTIGYLLSLRGAQLLIDEKPLSKIIPVDEYLPIMYDRHPNFQWKNYFQNRKLKAYAFHPSILTPTHYFGEPNYISDTENTTVLNNIVEDITKPLSVDVSSLVVDISDVVFDTLDKNIRTTKEEL